MQRICAFFLLGVLLVTSGCRTYGDYGSAEATYRHINLILERFEDDLSRARADVAALESAAGANPSLDSLAADYAIFVEAGEALLDQQRDLAADLSPGSSYRTLHRAHGAILAQQQTVRLQLRGLLTSFSEAHSPDTTDAGFSDRPYALIPPYYARVTGAQQDVSVNEILRTVRMPSPAPDSAAGESR